MTFSPTQSHCPDTEPTSPCPILTMPSARLGSDTINFKVIGLTRLRFGNVRSGFEHSTFGFPNLPEWEAGALLFRRPQLCSEDDLSIVWEWCVSVVWEWLLNCVRRMYHCWKDDLSIVGGGYASGLTMIWPLVWGRVVNAVRMISLVFEVNGFRVIWQRCEDDLTIMWR